MIHDYMLYDCEIMHHKTAAEGCDSWLKSCQTVYAGCQAVMRLLFCLILKHGAGQLKLMPDLCDSSGRGAAMN